MSLFSLWRRRTATSASDLDSSELHLVCSPGWATYRTLHVYTLDHGEGGGDLYGERSPYQDVAVPDCAGVRSTETKPTWFNNDVVPHYVPHSATICNRWVAFGTLLVLTRSGGSASPPTQLIRPRADHQQPALVAQSSRKRSACAAVSGSDSAHRRAASRSRVPHQREGVRADIVLRADSAG